jgi:hypothetical protein
MVRSSRCTVAMYERISASIVVVVHLYIYLGAAFAFVFVIFGVSKLDHEAHGAGPLFRAIIFPGAVALWPVLLSRWIRGESEPPLQKDPHR